MAQEYAKILIHLKQRFKVITRRESSAISFKKITAMNASSGGLKANLKKYKPPHTAIIAVGIEDLASVARNLINSGTKNILVEKPGGLNLLEINSLSVLAKKRKANVFIAYNRRFYSSVQKLKKLITKDGGLLSSNFEFTEWSHIIKKEKQTIEVKKNWVTGNSSHVIDLAFHLCGRPKYWKSWHDGSLDWHPASARYCGSGVSDQGVLFSYLSDWQGPGRWGLELITAKNRFILRPIEKLQVIKLKSNLVKFIELEDKLDLKFKPGVYHQTKNFLEKKYSSLCSIKEQTENVKIYSKIAGY
ncbi:hypothetical protein N8796_00920 [Candidatus Pelagibacter sp.]|nr:hypothetical protein [Candidatus Pelagibacter sp.]